MFWCSVLFSVLFWWHASHRVLCAQPLLQRLQTDTLGLISFSFIERSWPTRLHGLITQVAAPSLLMLFFNIFIELPPRKREGFLALCSFTICSNLSNFFTAPVRENGQTCQDWLCVFFSVPFDEDKDNVGKAHVIWCKDTVSGSRVREEIFWAWNCHPSWLIKLTACDIDLCPREKRPGAQLQSVRWAGLGSLRSGVVFLHLTQMKPENGKQGCYVLNTY